MIVSAINICHLIMNPFRGDRQPGGRPASAGHVGVAKHANGGGEKARLIQSCGLGCCFKKRKMEPLKAACMDLSNAAELLTLLPL